LLWQKKSLPSTNRNLPRETLTSQCCRLLALIFERRSAAPKTRSGAASLFSDVAVKSGLLDASYATVLSRGLDIRMDVDDEPLPSVTAEQAREYVDQAVDFVAKVTQLIEQAP
jgi:uncharacterized protein (UPF0332 family)